MDDITELKKRILDLKNRKEKKAKEEKKEKETNPQILLYWQAPLRPYRKFNFKIFRFFLALALLLSFIFIFFKAYTLIIPVWTLLFLFFALTVTPPPQVENKITVFGVETAGITAHWESLSYFYFEKKFGYDILNLVSHPPFNVHISMVVPDENVKKAAVFVLSKFLFYKEKPKKTFQDKMIEFFDKFIPDEGSSSSRKAVSS